MLYKFMHGERPLFELPLHPIPVLMKNEFSNLIKTKTYGSQLRTYQFFFKIRYNEFLNLL